MIAKRASRRGAPKAAFGFVWLPAGASVSLPATWVPTPTAGVPVSAATIRSTSGTLPVWGIATVSLGPQMYARPVGPQALLTRQEAAAALGGANRTTIYRLLRTRKLRVRRQTPEGEPLIPLTDVQRHLHTKRTHRRGRPLGRRPLDRALSPEGAAEVPRRRRRRLRILRRGGGMPDAAGVGPWMPIIAGGTVTFIPWVIPAARGPQTLRRAQAQTAGRTLLPRRRRIRARCRGGGGRRLTHASGRDEADGDPGHSLGLIGASRPSARPPRALHHPRRPGLSDVSSPSPPWTIPRDAGDDDRPEALSSGGPAYAA